MTPREIYIKQVWSSGVGEQIMGVHAFLMIAKFIKDTFGEKYKVIFTITGRSKCDVNLYTDADLISSKVDEFRVDDFHTLNQSHDQQNIYKFGEPSDSQLFGQPSFRNAITTTFDFKKTDDGLLLDKFIKENVENNHVLIGMMTSNHKHSNLISIYPSKIINKIYYKLAETFIENNKLDDFETIYYRFRAIATPHNAHIIEKKCVDDRLSTLSASFFEENKTYFISSNSSYFKEQIKLTYKNSVFLEKNFLLENMVYGDVVENISSECVNELLADSGEGLWATLGQFWNTKNEFLSLLEMAIMCKATKIFNLDCYCSMELPSLFLWYPTMVHKIPLTNIGADGKTVQDIESSEQYRLIKPTY